MTNQVLPVQAQPAPIALPAPPNFGWLMGQLSDTERRDVLDRIAEQAAEIFQTQLDAAYEAMGFVKLPPQERLAAYMIKPPAAWQEQSLKYPKDYEEDWADYQRLLERALNGDWDE